MKPYAQLTKRGQVKRLRNLVANALEQYDFEVSDIRCVGLFTNAIFRLRTTNGQSYIMRVCHPEWRTKDDLVAEIMWLQALSHDTNIRVPQPQATKSGDFIVESSADGVPESRRCVVMSWLPGTLLADKLNETNLFKMGQLFARLHQHGAQFVPQNGFTTRKMDSIYARGEPNVLFNEASQDAFRPQTMTILKQVDTKVKEMFAQLYSNPQRLQVIHNDLHHENIKLYRGQLFPFDFEDTIWGYPVQDIAMALQDLMVDVTRDEYEVYLSAFQAGYTTLLSWPEDFANQIDTLRAGRMLWVANYVARYQQQYLQEHIDWLAQQFEKFLDTGKIRKP